MAILLSQCTANMPILSWKALVNKQNVHIRSLVQHSLRVAVTWALRAERLKAVQSVQSMVGVADVPGSPTLQQDRLLVL